MVKVDKKKCIGCGACESICPEVFQLKNGKSEVKKQGNEPCIKEAAEACPVGAIIID